MDIDNHMSNQDKTVLISGASSGIGRVCALNIAEAGFNVIAGVRNEKAGNELEKESHGHLKTILLDITDKKAIESAALDLSQENLYGIVNNAGVAVLGPLEYLPLESIRRQFEVNLFGHIAVTQAFLPILRLNGGGRIINMSSISGFVAFPMFGPYAASKFALEAFNDALRRELRPSRIKVISIQPGNISTPIWEKSYLTAKTIAGNFPQEATGNYAGNSINSEKPLANLKGPSAVSKTVLRALSAQHPKTHYLVGRDARKYAVLHRILPRRLFERFV